MQLQQQKTSLQGTNVAGKTLGEQEFSNDWSNGQGERGAGRKSGSIVQERKQGMREQGEGNTIQEGEQGTTGGSMKQEGE